MLVWLLVSLVGWSEGGAPPVVHTGRGAVRGRLHPRPPHYAYLGIPYGRHVKADRFKAPQPARTWDGIFEATYKIKCPQPDGTGTEDCLAVNVFSPEGADGLPVVVLVHGGDFQSGWGPHRPPARLLAQGLVIVTFNYRIGTLGFLCLGTEDAPGNAGLKDQIAALYWIHKNIAYFGGDPQDVTLYGIESGAASVQLIMLSGAATGLFHKVILESGSALSPLALAYEPRVTAFEDGSALGFNSMDSLDDLITFYKNLPIRKIVKTTSSFLPCLENNLNETHSLLDTDPLELYRQNKYQQVPMIIAFTSSEGSPAIQAVLENSTLPEDFDNLLPNNLSFDSSVTKHRVAEVVKEFYVGNNAFDGDPVRNYIDYFNDVTVEYPIIKTAVLHAATSSLPVYLIKIYLSNQDSNGSKENKGYRSILEHFYSTQEDQIIVEQLVTLWSNFIKIGDPTPLTTSLIPMVWPPVEAVEDENIKTVQGLEYKKVLKVSSQLANERITFLDHIYKRFYKAHEQLFDELDLDL